jgi:demethoxyubiquinone hydroxylase (CLK1/Coq7/Cat5 family)
MLGSLVDMIKNLDKSLQERLNALIPFGAKKPTSPQSAQTQQTQPKQVITQPFPDYHSGTMEFQVNPFTGAIKTPSKIFPPYGGIETGTVQIAKKSSPKTTSPTKKALTAETLTSEDSLPLWPYSPQGILELLKQGKINLPQALQMLQNIATKELSLEDWVAQIRDNIRKLPDEIKAEMEKEEKEMNRIYKDLENNMKEQVKVYQKYADEQLKVLREHLNWIRQVFTDLMQEKPSLEPDKWTEFGRRLAMALGAISALVHPQYAPYFYMAIPQVVQYWQNEDMYNFEKAMKKFELALKLAGTQLDFYNQIMQHNLTIIDKLKEKELLPLTVAGQLLMEQYHAYVDAYNKLKAEYARALSDRIAHEISALKTGGMLQHYKDWKEVKKMDHLIKLKELEHREKYNRIMAGIKNAMAQLTYEKFNLEKLKQFYPWLFPSELIKSLGIKDNPEVAFKIFMLYALHGPEKAFFMIPKILKEYNISLNAKK